MSKKKILLFWSLLVLLLGSFALVISPVFHSYASRVLVPAKSDYEKDLERYGYKMGDLRARAPYVMFRPKPGVKVINTKTKKSETLINSLGFKSPEIPKKKKKNEYRIALLGGSAAFNGEFAIQNENNSDTIIAEFVKKLARDIPWARDKEVTYINAAIPSAVSGQELAQFLYNVLPMDIDLLIVFDGFNDFYIPFNYDPRPGYPFDSIVQEYRYYKYYTHRNWLDTFYLLFDPGLIKGSSQNVVTDYFKALGIERPKFDDEYVKNILSLYLNNMQTISVIANAYGIKTAIFLQPYSPVHKQTKQVVDLYAMANKKFEILSKANSQNLLFYDMTRMTDELKDLFVDIVHFKWHSPGNAMVAKRMIDIMEENGMLDEPYMKQVTKFGVAKYGDIATPR